MLKNHLQQILKIWVYNKHPQDGPYFLLLYNMNHPKTPCKKEKGTEIVEPIRKKIALLGMYGGMWREYNPGCYLTCLQTLNELKKRLPTATFDIFAIDNKLESPDILQENLYGLDINFFSRSQQKHVLNNILTSYDALVVGGDIIWGGDDVVADNEIFFIDSEEFLHTTKPIVLFNCVHTFYDDHTIHHVQDKINRACQRAAYISVRTPAIKARIEKFAEQPVNCVPDLVLDFDTTKFPVVELPTNHEQPIMGLSLRAKLLKETRELLSNLNLQNKVLLIYPFSRQYDNLRTVLEIKKQFGTKFSYLEEYLPPLESFAIIGNFDLSINDTFHGTSAAIIQHVPFLSIDIETESTSRKDQLLRTLELDTRRNIRLLYNHPDNSKILSENLTHFLTEPYRPNPAPLEKARQVIRTHFDRMVQIITQ